MSSHGWEHDILSDLSPDKTKTQGAPAAQTLKSMYFIQYISQIRAFPSVRYINIHILTYIE